MLVCTIIVGGIYVSDKCAIAKRKPREVAFSRKFLLHPRNARCSVAYCPSEHRPKAARFHFNYSAAMLSTLLYAELAEVLAWIALTL